MTIALIVHGGARAFPAETEQRVLAAVTRAVHSGGKILADGGSAIEAASAAVAVLEDDPAFNAGLGAALNFDGEVETDACLMESAQSRFGAVCCLKSTRNPILVARRLMNDSDCHLLAGEGALEAARALGFPEYDLVTEERRLEWIQLRNVVRSAFGERPLRYANLLGQGRNAFAGTVGSVALDRHGTLCAASSSGGSPLKSAGTVGATSMPGAGTYAAQHAAVSVCGPADVLMLSQAARRISDHLGQGYSLKDSMRLLDHFERYFDRDIGFVALTSSGERVVAHRSKDLPHGWYNGEGEVEARMRSAGGNAAE